MIELGNSEMRYDLLDAETGNLYDRFPTEETALAFVRALIEANGADIVDSLVLGGRDAAGRILPVQTGTELARHVRAAAPDRLPLGRRP